MQTYAVMQKYPPDEAWEIKMIKNRNLYAAV